MFYSTAHAGDVNYDAFGSHNGYNFVTHDRDVNNCVVSHGGGFWYSNCADARLNAASHLFDWRNLAGGDDLMFSQMWLECP